MKKTTKALSLILATAMLCSLFAGCGAKQSADAGTTFTVALGSDIMKLDPAFAYDFTTNPVVNQITQGLLTFDSNDKLQPMLASSWEEVDSLTYVYNVRDDVNFSDGTPMTMEDVIFSIERVKNPDTASYLSWMLDNVASIEQTGDWQLTIRLSQPDATWQYVPGTTACHIVSKAFAEKAGEDFGTAKGGLLGTGPFQYVSWQSGTEVVLEKNPNYWNKEAKVDFDKLVFKIISEDTSMVTALQTEAVDFTAEPPLDMLQTLRDSGKVELSANEGFAVTLLAFNTQKEPFDDVNVRKAIYHAIDMESIQENIIKEAGIAATTLPNSMALATIEEERWADYAAKAPKYTYDLEKAKEYMAKSSAPDGFDCNLLTTESAIRYSLGLAIQEALKPLNINVELTKLSSDEHTAYQFGDKFADGVRDYDMILAGWEADFPDPSGNLVPLYVGSNAGEGGANAAAYVNPKVDEYLAAQGVISDPAERTTLMFQALDIITEDIPYIFCFYPTKNTAINKKYAGFKMNASWLWNLHFEDIHAVA